MNHGVGTDSEVGSLRTVLAHRPGPELRRITPRTLSRLDFGAVPWLARAQAEHDTLTDVLREHGAEVLYVTELLQDVLEYSAARETAIASALAAGELGNDLAAAVRRHLAELPPEDLAATLIAGLTSDELRTGCGLVYELLDPRDFLVDPLPNLVFSRDSSPWVGDRPVLAALRGARRRETDLMAVIYQHHPRFTGLKPHGRPSGSALHGGDLVLLGPGVVAVGVGVRTTPASAEHLARQLLSGGFAHTMLAVPLGRRGTDCHLDMLCTVVGPGTAIMVQSVAFTLTALTITLGQDDDMRVSRPQPFLEAAARAIGTDGLTVIDTGIDAHGGTQGQWDNCANALALGHGVIVSDERNSETNLRLAAAGFDVVTVPGSELGGLRGGPRCMCAAICRDPAGQRDRPPARRQSEPPGPRPPAIAAGGPAAAAPPGAPESPVSAEGLPDQARPAPELTPTR